MRTAADPIEAGGGSACAVHTGATPRCKITSDVQRLAKQLAPRLTRVWPDRASSDCTIVSKLTAA